MSDGTGLLDWLATAEPAGAEPGLGEQGFPVVGPAGVGAADALVAWAALLYHHTGRRDQAFRVVDGGADEVVSFTIDPAGTLAALAEQVKRALAAAEPYAPGPEPLPVLARGDGQATGPLVLALDGGGARLRYAPGGDAGMAARHAAHLAAVLATPADRTIREVDPLSSAEHARLGRWNDTATGYPAHRRIERLFAEQAERAPAHPAVVHGSTILTYAELDHRSMSLAGSLLRAGLRPGEPVALLLPRTPELVVSALAVLKAGGCYLPIDPSTGQERVAFTIEDSGAELLIASGRPPATPAGSRVVDLGDHDWTGEPEPVGPAPGDAAAPAYLMYTSGTTGRPKGVMIPHRGVVRLVRGVAYVRLDATTRMAQVGATGFDASVWEIWGALLNGGTLHVLDRETFLDAGELRRALADAAITTALFTSALFSRLADEDPAVFRPLRDLLVGGDVLSPEHAEAVLRAGPGLRLVNAYGPTENAVISTVHTVAGPFGARVPIGRPVPNTTAYVLNQDRLPLPAGVPGDLYVGGDGMATGYHGRPELTERAFVRHAGRLLYRTGDRARRRPDGSIDFLGREDRQVKVRGFRVEPGEVEAALLGVAGVSGAAVVPRGTPEPHLCAYVEGRVEAEHVRAEIERRLPAHLVPAHLVVLPELPLTGNGKVDLAGLPDPEVATGGRAARDEVERILAGLWEDVLGVRGIGADDPLDRLGGSSLTATRVSALVRRRFGVACPVSAVLSARTVAELADTVRAADRTQVTGPRPGTATERTPLSPQQHGVHVEQVKDPADTQYNLPVVVDLPGPVDQGRLTAALATLVERHEILRAEIAVDGDGRPYQRVREPRGVTIDAVDLPPGEDPDAWARRWVRPFDLARAPLWRAALVRHDAGTRLALDVHHLLTDGHALTLLMGEWAALVRGERPPEAAELRYRDYAQWAAGPERRALSDGQRAFWEETFERPVAPLDLPVDVLADAPADLTRPSVRTTEGGHLAFRFGPRRAQAVRELARAESVTPFHVLLAAYTAFLGRVSGSADVTVGTAASGRHLPGVDRVLGMFVNTLCLRARPSAELPFLQHLRAVAAHAVAAVDHQDHTLDVARHGRPSGHGRHPLFDTFFAVQDTGLQRVDFLGGRPRWRPDLTGRTIFDLDLQIEVEPDDYAARWAYATALFLRPTVELFRDELLALLDAALADPGTPLGSLGEPLRAAAPHDLSELAFDFDF
ncbi:amino acid adenylation domain-containing protein [Nonomuraea sp. KC401]|uniref:non-ribosomal peptide synthetase n=1 Tax=unclassified Nonomuraea TaxID=2593643 RepID=UPI0010FE98A6|nr:MULTISPECIES: non-ribosomal peptide synthetase [unclassified Nonomuraea]NBE99428.1 amino acid adenylation domain-containing protein [Nonomuraea sp. K271]TLF57388.1 amino acid adenylation domain-containing protein [Nonomuraea sp. KC401]